MEDEEDQLPPEAPAPVPNTFDKMAAAGFGAIAGMVVAGPVGAAVGAIAAPAAEQLMTRVRLEWTRRGEIVLTEAEAEAGLPRDDLLERLALDDELQALLARVIAASSATAFERKLVAQGRVLGRAVSDVLRVDEAVCMAAALNDLEKPHVALLERLNEPNPDADENSQGWSRRQLVTAMPEAAHLIPNLVGILERHGLAVDNRGGMTYLDDVRPFIASDLGRTCLDVLRVARSTNGTYGGPTEPGAAGPSARGGPEV